MNRCILKSVSAALLSAAPLTALVISAPAQAGVRGSTSEINTDEQGLALRGYDPVAYFDSGKPTHGLQSLSASFGGARYLFASAAHRKAFLADPKKYVPEFGGFCALGTAFGEKVDTDPETGQVVGGKLYLNNGPKALELFNQDRTGTIEKAEGNWPVVKGKAF
jgi:YHS domain-containing protein